MSVPDVLERSGIRLGEMSLVVRQPRRLGWEDFLNAAEVIAAIGRAYPFWVGDLMNVAHDVLGEDFAQLEKHLPHSPHTISNYRSVASRIPDEDRRPSLSFSVHAEVAYLKPRERDAWLDKAERYDWKREEMRDALRPHRAITAGPVGNSAVTGKSEDSVTSPREELSSGEPAATTLSISEPVPGPAVCPHCGRPYDDLEGSVR